MIYTVEGPLRSDLIFHISSLIGSQIRLRFGSDSTLTLSEIRGERRETRRPSGRGGEAPDTGIPNTEYGHSDQSGRVIFPGNFSR